MVPEHMHPPNRINEAVENLLKDKSSVSEAKTEQTETTAMKKRHEQNWVFLRKIGGKPIIWKCPKYHFPRNFFTNASIPKK